MKFRVDYGSCIATEAFVIVVIWTSEAKRNLAMISTPCLLKKFQCSHSLPYDELFHELEMMLMFLNAVVIYRYM